MHRRHPGHARPETSKRIRCDAEVRRRVVIRAAISSIDISDDLQLCGYTGEWFGS